MHSDYVVYQNPKKNKRWIDYHGEALLCVTDKKGSTSATLWCSNEHLAHELSYLYLLSKIGFFLDSKGLHRVHALGIHQHHLGALILIPSGGGKSSLALELLEKNNLTLLSDDSPLVDRKGNLHPFPMRIAFRHNTKLPVNLEKNAGYMERRKYGGKKLVSMAQLPHPPTRTNTTIKPKLLVIAERHGSKKYPKFRSLSKLQALQYLLRDMVVGLGLPQLAELILTKGLWTLPLLVPTAASRALAAARLIAKSDCVVLELSTDKKENAALLYKKLSSYNLVDKQKNNIIIK